MLCDKRPCQWLPYTVTVHTVKLSLKRPASQKTQTTTGLHVLLSLLCTYSLLQSCWERGKKKKNKKPHALQNDCLLVFKCHNSGIMHIKDIKWLATKAYQDISKIPGLQSVTLTTMLTCPCNRLPIKINLQGPENIFPVHILLSTPQLTK